MAQLTIETAKGDYIITTDPGRVDTQAVASYLTNESYWARGRPPKFIKQSIASSVVFGLLTNDSDAAQTVGFSRLVTDGITFGWLCDVYVLDAHRGLGLGKALVDAVTAYADSTGIGQLILATADAHGLYESYGFQVVPDNKFLSRRHPKLNSQ